MKMFKFRPRRVSSEQEEAARWVFWRVVVNIFIFRNSPKYTQELCRFVFVLFLFWHIHAHTVRDRGRRIVARAMPLRLLGIFGMKQRRRLTGRRRRMKRNENRRAQDKYVCGLKWYLCTFRRSAAAKDTNKSDIVAKRFIDLLSFRGLLGERVSVLLWSENIARCRNSWHAKTLFLLLLARSLSCARPRLCGLWITVRRGTLARADTVSRWFFCCSIIVRGDGNCEGLVFVAWNWWILHNNSRPSKQSINRSENTFRTNADTDKSPHRPSHTN